MNSTDGSSFGALVEGFADLIASKVSRRLVSNGLNFGDHGLTVRLLSVKEVAKRIGRPANSVYRMTANGTLPVVHSDKRVLVDERDLEKWIEENKCRR